MAGLDLIAIQDNITAYVAQEFSGYPIYEDDIIDDEFVLKQENKIKPYIVLRWDGLRSSGTGPSFVGARFDEYYSVVDITVIAPAPRQARLALNIIVDKLIGWKPTGSTPLAAEGGAGYWPITDNSGRPHVYAASYRLRFNVNAENVGSYITP
jgi:hypothetical protein